MVEVAEMAGVASVADTANVVTNAAANTAANTANAANAEANVQTVMNYSGSMEMCNILLKDSATPRHLPTFS